ncbi:MAG: leucine-rich repeat protein, partial [Clostridia bacterium]|nr:leucine-rich repeat protein [Clostridia bacterium]
LTSIGKSSFSNCENLTNITIPENVTFIGSGAFSRCEQLSEVVFEQTSGWRVEPQGGKFVSATKLNKEKLDSPATAAEYISQTYASWEWHRDD